METAVAKLGHNRPPEPTPHEVATLSINDLYNEAKNYLDGEKIDRQEIADDISKLLNLIRAAKKAADAARRVENRPFDEGKAEVQARYNPLLNKADLAMTVCKKALEPWLEKLDAEKKAIAQKARAEAEEKQRQARESYHATDQQNLEQRERTEALIEDAKAADIAAKRANSDTAKASGGVGRAVSLRTTPRPVLNDPVVAVRHYWAINQPAIEAVLTSLAETDVRGGVRNIPGFEIVEERKAV